MKATDEQMRQAARWGERLSALLDDAEQDDIDFRLVRSILKDAMGRVNETIYERDAKGQR